MQLLQLVSLLSSAQAAPANTLQKRQLGFALDANVNAGLGLGYGYGYGYRPGGYGLSNNFYQPYAYYSAFNPGYQIGVLVRNAVHLAKPVSEEEAQCNAFLTFAATKPMIKAKMMQDYGSIMTGDVSLTDEIKPWHAITSTDAEASTSTPLVQGESTTTHGSGDSQSVQSTADKDTVASPVVSTEGAKEHSSKKQPPTCLDLTEYIILYGDAELAANLESAYGEWNAKMQAAKSSAVVPESPGLSPSPGTSTPQTTSAQSPAVPSPAMAETPVPLSAPAALSSPVNSFQEGE